MLTDKRTEILLNLVHLSIDIAVGDNRFRADDALLTVIKTEKEDGKFCFKCDIVKSTFPFSYRFACAFRGDAERKGVTAACGFGQLIGEAGATAAHDGYATEMTEQGAKGPEEPFLLHHELTAETLSMTIELAHEEIPVAGVRGKGDDVFLRALHGDFRTPAHQAIEDKARKTAHCGSDKVKDVVDNLVGTDGEVIL